jgi:hypothetical protein
MKKKSLIVGLLGLAIGLLVLVILVAKGGEEAAKRDIASATIQKDGNTLIINSDGTVTYETESGVYEDFWDADKTSAFFAYIDSNYSGTGEIIVGGQNYISVNGSTGTTTYALGDDELIDTVEDETSGEGSGGDGGSGGSGGSGGQPTPTPTVGQGGSGGGGSGGGPDSECLYWRLSYCVRPRTPSPTPSSTPVTVEIREPNCEANTQTGRTVIGNDLCLPTPSPTP